MSMQDNQEQKEIKPAGAKKRPAASGSLLFWRIAASVLLLAVIALGTQLFLSKAGISSPVAETVSETPAPEETASFTALCYTPVGDTLSVSAQPGETVVLPQGPQIDGYTFIGWADIKGDLVRDNEVTLYNNAAFSAIYAIAFRDQSSDASHQPYMLLDEENLFHPHDNLLRSEAIGILYALLDTDAEGSGSFSDVDRSAGYYKAAATLKDLGVISGSRFHPDDPISCSELFDMLAHFFPASSSLYAFENIPEVDPRYGAFCLAMDRGWIEDLSVLPDRDLTRAEAAHIFNLLCGRAPLAESDTAKVGTILDVSFRDPYFWDIAEAAIPHEPAKSDSGELWASSTPLELHEEGFFFIGTELHCADAEGSALVDESYGNFDFGPDGAITTGMPELDEYVQEKLQELVDPATMEPEKMLRTVYDHVTYRYSYLRANIYEIGETGWVNDEAYRMFSTGKGNCYSYAAAFGVLAKALGYDAICYSGTIGVAHQPHGWTEIEIDGINYIFDTNIEYEEHVMAHKSTCMFKLPPERVTGWYYIKDNG